MEDIVDAEKRAEVDRMNNQTAEVSFNQSILADMTGEKEKITFALELAIHEVTKKSHKKGEGEEGEDATDRG